MKKDHLKVKFTIMVPVEIEVTAHKDDEKDAILQIWDSLKCDISETASYDYNYTSRFDKIKLKDIKTAYRKGK